MNRCLIASAMVLIAGLGSSAEAQLDCVSYKLVPETVYKVRPVNLTRTVNETAMETKQVVTYKPVWTRETRQRVTTVMKPVVTTSQREERYLVRRPIIETSYREREIKETSFETVTEMSEKRYLVESPVVETQLREEEVVVRKPVTKTLIQSENVTTYKPTTTSETQFVAGANVRNDLFLQSGRNRLRWLPSGVYVDPTTGASAYRQRGLRWARDQNLVLQPTIEPTLIPQQVTRTTYNPETVTVRKPVQVTEYVDQIEKRKVPVQVSTTSKKIYVVKTPVTVQKPVTKIRTEKIPVEEVKYREEVYTRKIPVTETRYQRVEKSEPYEVNVCKWVTETSEIQVPRTVARRINYSVDQVCPEVRWRRVPFDAFGNPLSAGEIVASQQPAVIQVAERPTVKSRLLKPVTPASGSEKKMTTVIGAPIVVRKLGYDEYRKSIGDTTDVEKAKSVLMPNSDSRFGTVKTDLVEVAERPTLARRPNVELPTPLLDPDADAAKQPQAEPKSKPLIIELPPEPKSPDAVSPAVEAGSIDHSGINVRPGSSGSANKLDLSGPGN